jgi:hypothetical protein
VPEIPVGVPGTERGVTAGDDFDEYEPCPAAFTAATWNVYAVPLVSPVTFTEVSVEAVRVKVEHVEEIHD